MMTQNEERIVPMRLQKFLARAGVASRRGSENLMTAGRVTVNGEVVTELGSRVDPLKDIVTVDGKEVMLADESVVIMLHKPAGYITTMSDPYDRPCVAELIPTDEHPGLYPVGRLDADTTGLLLFTTDGELGNNLLHPKKEVHKTYEALVKGKPTDAELARLERGIELEDGMTAPARVSRIGTGPQRRMEEHVPPCAAGDPSLFDSLTITIHEGRKRQVKRMFEAIGHPVVRLHRSSFAGLTLGALTEGTWRKLSQEERDSLNELI